MLLEAPCILAMVYSLTFRRHAVTSASSSGVKTSGSRESYQASQSAMASGEFDQPSSRTPTERESSGSGSITSRHPSGPSTGPSGTIFPLFQAARIAFIRRLLS
ncbi:MAG: hypothetical protein ACYC61_24770 [Isosphaeraceae bacterium]